jgi:hypothetical protein
MPGAEFMKGVVFEIRKPGDFTEADRSVFLTLLQQQGKNIEPKPEDVDRCFFLAMCKLHGTAVSIGALKPADPALFGSSKADLSALASVVHAELGYCYTLPEYGRKHYMSKIVRYLIQLSPKENLMASTELRKSNGMRYILARNGFQRYGRKWKSAIHGGNLGLFLRFSNPADSVFHH